MAGSGFSCAEYYLRRELNRRKASMKNPGRKVKYKDERHEKWREASRKHREKQARQTMQEIDKEAYRASIEQEKEQSSREIVPFEDL